MQYTLTSVFILTMNVIVALAFVAILRKSGATSRLLAIVCSALAAWWGLVFVAFATESAFPSDLGGTTLFAVIVATVVVVTGLMFTPALRQRLLSLPLGLLMLPQGLRAFFGAGFLIEAVLGIMPRAFGIADGITHISAAFFALMAAYICATSSNGRGAAWFANLFGLLDIVLVAGGIAFVLLQEIGPHHNVMYAAFFAAPIFIGLHVVTIYKLWTTEESTTVTAATSASV
jgi:hypothetical protein